jgi:hypothetical protein
LRKFGTDWKGISGALRDLAGVCANAATAQSATATSGFMWGQYTSGRGSWEEHVRRRAGFGALVLIWLYYWIYGKEGLLSTTPQKRALNNYRKRLNQRGMARFEVLGRDGDRDLIRALAKRLAGDDPEAVRIRATVRRSISTEPPKKGGILDALRRSPLVGADLDLKRPVIRGRKVDL